MKTAILTIREAFESYYDSDELSNGTKTTMRAAIRLWERHTDNPPAEEITNAMVASFRQAMIESGLAPTTINTAWRQLRSILRRIGPVTDGNPWALELIPRVPAMRPVEVPFKRPRRLTMEEIDRLYLAARHMKLPNRNVANPAFWWQAIIVLAYFTGLRRSDLLKVKWSDFDEKNATVYVKTQKTKIEADLPLPAVVFEHLERMQPRRTERVFGVTTGLLDKYMRLLKQQANIKDFHGFHDIRRTACSEADAVTKGMGKVLLLHAPNNVTECSYLNSLPELREVVNKMNMPASFRHGPKMVMRMIRDARKEVSLRPHHFAAPVHPPADLFGFTSSGLSFAGIFYSASPMRIAVVRTFVENAGVCTQEQLWRALYDGPLPLGKAKDARMPLMRDLSSTRNFLRRILQLPKGFNPIVPTLLHESHRQRLCQYELFLPPALWASQNEGGAV